MVLHGFMPVTVELVSIKNYVIEFVTGSDENIVFDL